MSGIRWLLALTTLALAVGRTHAAAADLPDGFSEQEIATGITGATAMTIAPDGRIFICEQTGALRVVKQDQLLSRPVLTVRVESYWERGLLGVAVDPDFSTNHYLYICYTSPVPYSHHRISRFTLTGDMAAPQSERILLEGDDQAKLGRAMPFAHQGGALHFGPDGKLYIAIGDQREGSPSQRLDTLLGKLLRINPDGSIPVDNPFFRVTKGKYRAIWALGLRNPYTFAFQPGTGRLFINDVGESRWEEIDEGHAGANYGWPESEGPTSNPKFRAPLHYYGRDIGKSITGGTFYNPARRQFPAKYMGKYFFMDFMDNWIRVLDPDNPKAISVFATGLAAPVDIRVGPDGSLYYLNRNAWVKDQDFKPRTGALHRICYTANSGRPAPLLTAQTGDLQLPEGGTAELSVTATGSSPLRYHWQKNGVPIQGATSSRYILASASNTDHGAQLRCVVSNVFGTTKSRPVTLEIFNLQQSENPVAVTGGLERESFQGTWTALPGFELLKPGQKSVVNNVELPRGEGHKRTGYRFSGFLEAPRDGVYTFFLSTSGAAKVFIGSADIVSIGHGTSTRGRSGSIGLKAGKHTFQLAYVPHEGHPPILELTSTGPGLDRQRIPDARFSHIDPAVLAAPLIRPQGGTFTGPVRICLTTTTAAATLRYTTDGSEPTAFSPVYHGPFLLERSATVRAKTFKGDQAQNVPLTTSAFQITGNQPYGLTERERGTTLNIPQNATDLPPLLSQTGVFHSLTDLSPNPGILPYDVNSPLWSDGAAKRRWLALPGNQRIEFSEMGEWKFPAGTVFIKHFEMGGDAANGSKPRRLETRVLVVDRTGKGYGATYKWRVDQTDAELLTEGITEEFTLKTRTGTQRKKWAFPSRNDCLVCHTANAGFVLGVNTRQLNRSVKYAATNTTDNQLRTWNYLQLFEPSVPETSIPRYAKLAALSDKAASLEHRVRSYLDSNCAQCHRPGGVRSEFDARFETPLSRQNLINRPLIGADLGIRNARLIAANDPSRSMIEQRMKRRQDVFNMPPLATHEVDREAVAVLEEWIKRLAPPPRRVGIDRKP